MDGANNSSMNSVRKGSYNNGDKENCEIVTGNKSYSNNNNVSINVTSPINNTTHLPCISPKSLNSSSIINKSQSITVFSK